MPRLALTRRRNERVIVTVPASDQTTRIVVELAHIDRERARIAFEAPSDVRVNREEVEARAEGGAA